MQPRLLKSCTNPQFGERQVRDSRCVERWQAGWSLPALRPIGRGFIRTVDGAALVEYALLLGALVCVAMAGVSFYDDMGIPVFHRLSETLSANAESGADKLAHDEFAGVEALQSEKSEWQNQPYHAIIRPATVFLAAAIVIALLWLATRWRRTRMETAGREPANERSEDRLQVKRQILWRNILEDPKLLFKNRVEVRHLMTRDVTVIARRTQADEIRRLMSTKHLHHVLVCDSDGQLLGVVSDRDLPEGREEVAARIMTCEPMTVRPDTTASAAIAIMLEHQISCLPVLNDSQLCGILTRTDLLLSLQCMLQWWLRFAQTLARTADCADKIDAVQEASGRYLFEQRARLEALAHFANDGESSGADRNWQSFEQQARIFLDTAGELIAMQTFEEDRLSEMAGDLLEIARS